MKRQHDSFTNSGLGRAKPRHHVFHSFVNTRLKRNRSQMGLVEDRTSSTTIVRIIIGLLMLHLVIIGGVLLKGHVDKMAGGVSVPPALTPPPRAAQNEVLSQPPAAPVASATPAQASSPAAPVAAAPAGNHITQSMQGGELFPEGNAAVAAPAPTPVVVNPPVLEPAPAAPAAPATPAPAEATTTIKHLVNSGDTWYGIAQKHGISMDALKAANPTAARKTHLYQGSYLNVPVKADSEAARAAAAAQPVETPAATYTVKRGDTLAKIARKHKMSVPALMKLNDLTEKDARRIKIGQELKVGK